MNTTILEKTDNGDVVVDIYSKLTSDRVLFLTNVIDDRMASDITAALLYLDNEDSSKKISLYINVEEGSDIRSVFTIYDTLNLIQSPIETFCIGACFNEAILLLASGEKGMRYATSNSFFYLNQLMIEGYMHTDMPGAKIFHDRIKLDNDLLMKHLAKVTKQKPSTILKDSRSKKFMNAVEAKKYGIIDEIISK